MRDAWALYREERISRAELDRRVAVSPESFLSSSVPKGLVKVGLGCALDGTKVKADAALEANRTYDNIENEVKEMLDRHSAKAGPGIIPWTRISHPA